LFIDIYLGKVFECKNDKYAVVQGFNEMICMAGNIVAQTLQLVEPVNIADIYGLAIYYKEKHTFLLHLHINFAEEKSVYVVSDDTETLHDTIMWLLNITDKLNVIVAIATAIGAILLDFLLYIYNNIDFLIVYRTILDFFYVLVWHLHS